MAYLPDGTFKFLGSIKGLTAYKIRGSDKIFLRAKGGPSKTKVKKSAAFANPRKNMSEFGGRSTTAKLLMKTIQSLSHISDHNILAALNSLLRPVQKLDTTSELGKRNILLSLNPQFLQGFNLNRKNSLDSIIRPDISYELSKQTMSATIKVPELLPGYSFKNPTNYSWYRISAVLAVITDVVYTKGDYNPANISSEGLFGHVDSTWFPSNEGSPACELQLTLPAGNLSSCSLMLMAGISFGAVKGADHIEPVKHLGAAKIIGML
jgi:hypothetical protein